MTNRDSEVLAVGTTDTLKGASGVADDGVGRTPSFVGVGTVRHAEAKQKRTTAMALRFDMKRRITSEFDAAA